MQKQFSGERLVFLTKSVFNPLDIHMQERKKKFYLYFLFYAKINSNVIDLNIVPKTAKLPGEDMRKYMLPWVKQRFLGYSSKRMIQKEKMTNWSSSN